MVGSTPSWGRVGKGALVGIWSGLRRAVRGGILDGGDQFGGDGAEFDVAPLGDCPQGRKRRMGVAMPLGHHDPDGLIDDRARRQRDAQVIGQGDLVVVAQRRGDVRNSGNSRACSA